MTNKIKGLRPPPKISSCFGPIIIVIPTIFVQYKLVPQLYIMPASCLNQHNQHPNICWEILSQSNSTFLKLKFETVWNRDFHWLVWHPGVGVFLLFGETTKMHCFAWWPASVFKYLLCDRTHTNNCLRLLSCEILYYLIVLSFFFLQFSFWFQSLITFGKCIFFVALICYDFELLLPPVLSIFLSFLLDPPVA